MHCIQDSLKISRNLEAICQEEGVKIPKSRISRLLASVSCDSHSDRKAHVNVCLLQQLYLLLFTSKISMIHNLLRGAVTSVHSCPYYHYMLRCTFVWPV